MVKQIATMYLIRLKTLLAGASKGRYGRDMAETIQDVTRCSIDSRVPTKSLELQRTIRLVREPSAEIEEIETAIQIIMDELQLSITMIMRIGYRMGTMILVEVGALSCFDSPD